MLRPSCGFWAAQNAFGALRPTHSRFCFALVRLLCSRWQPAARSRNPLCVRPRPASLISRRTNNTRSDFSFSSIIYFFRDISRSCIVGSVHYHPLCRGTASSSPASFSFLSVFGIALTGLGSPETGGSSDSTHPYHYLLNTNAPPFSTRSSPTGQVHKMRTRTSSGWPSRLGMSTRIF